MCETRDSGKTSNIKNVANLFPSGWHQIFLAGQRDVCTVQSSLIGVHSNQNHHIVCLLKIDSFSLVRVGDFTRTFKLENDGVIEAQNPMTTNTANYKIFLEDVLKVTCAGRSAKDDEVVWSTKNQIESLLNPKSHWTYTHELLWEKCLITPAQLVDLTLTDPQTTIEKKPIRVKIYITTNI